MEKGMPGRWRILALLFFVRAAMAVQFQSVGSIAPLLGAELGIGLADIGVLIGLYYAPGVVLALPGGAIGQKYGDKATVCAGLVLMAAGQLAMTLLASWSGQIAGRLLAGIGGVILNILMTKMVADWFADRELSTATAIFINSWPAGIALALLLLPPIGAAHGVSAVYMTVVALVTVALGLLAALYEAPASPTASAEAETRLDRSTVIAVIAAGVIWALFNIGYTMIFSFGPSMLVERGWSIAAAGSTTSIVLWLSAISVPLGGFIADRTQRHDLVLVSSSIAYAALLILASRVGPTIPAIVALGLVCGLGVGPILRLPAIVLQPGVRALGIGLFYAPFYLGVMLGPAVGGRYASWAGTAGASFDFGAGAVLLCPVILWVFHHMAKAAPAAEPCSN
jgi:MFS family permease